MARVVREIDPAGQALAEAELGWNRQTIRKGLHELDSGPTCLDAYGARGRLRAEEKLPNLLSDLREIVDSQSQSDPQFKNNRLYRRLSVAEIRRQLISQKGYTEEELPSAVCLGYKLNQMGYYQARVAKTKPKKR